MKFTTQFIAAFVALATSANAHMIMRTPQPFNTPDSSPINTDGSNFPCKIAGGSGDVKSGPVNAMTVGQMNTLSFTGGATHGGGSCQVSMAKGTTVNANTKWMVIYSIEGNCPIEGDNNLSGNPSDTGSNQFQFAVPDHPDLPSGDYTLAWTWNNKIGNREFYMNCAYVQLQGASKKRYEPSQPVKKDTTPLPDMLVVNIPQGNGCAIPENFDLQYPNPGDDSRVKKYPSGKFMLPTGNCGAVVNNAGSGSGSGSSSAAAAGTTAAAASSTSGGGFSAAKSTMTNTVSPLAASGTLSASPGVFATVGGGGGASQAPSMAASSAPAVYTTFATSAASFAPASPASSAASPMGTSSTGTGTGTGTGGGSSTSVGAQSGPCTNEGAWSCAADGKSFQRCASGSWSVSMQMAAGMSCVPGISDNLSYSTSGHKVRRDTRSHNLHRRHNLHGAVFS